MAFLAALLDRSTLYRYADPFGALNLAVMRDGDELHWHFDQTDFVVSIAIQSSIDGGDFDNAKLIRSSGDEHYDDVAAVLAGRAPERVRTEPMTPGTLMVFEGRNSMHRVDRSEVTRCIELRPSNTMSVPGVIGSVRTRSGARPGGPRRVMLVAGRSDKLRVVEVSAGSMLDWITMDTTGVGLVRSARSAQHHHVQPREGPGAERIRIAVERRPIKQGGEERHQGDPTRTAHAGQRSHGNRW